MKAEAAHMLWIGIDVGGTFTDAVACDDETGDLRFAKAPSTPHDPAQAVLDVLDKLRVEGGEIERFVHGVTIGTNAVLEGKGAEVWMLVTRGFRDVLEIGRTNRPVLYDIRTQKAQPLVPRTRALEIHERMLFDGRIHTELDPGSLREAVRLLPRGKDAAVAICFLHSYANPAHERAAEELLARERPDLFVCTSSGVLPQLREYERFSTTALNAYIGPLMGRYLARLQSNLKARDFRRNLYIMTSGGGVATAERATRLPAATVLSGPAGGVAAALHLGEALDIRNVITCDMGGTSTDVCLIEDLTIPVTNDQKIAEHANRLPQIAINAVGAGGGSIGWIDAGDILMVGPQSAGASPGPACYGRGGTVPTVTDANLALNRLSPGSPLGGQIVLDRALAVDALEKLGGRMGLDAMSLADGIIRIAVARMVSAIKQVSIADGHDPRDFALVPFGGAGPMHAAAIAEELEMTRIVVPVGPGNFAAFGSLISDLRRDYVQTRTVIADATTWPEIDKAFSAIEAQARADLAAEGVAAADIELKRSAGMRYLGQSWELNVDLARAKTAEDAIAAFGDVHDKRFGHRSGGAVEIVNFRLAGIGRVPKPKRRPLATITPRDDAMIGRREVHLGGRFVTTPVYLRDRLALSQVIEAPAVIEELGSTTIVPPGWRARVIGSGELMLERVA
ncbi:MAG: hydantoinase/oxoprolinase family protein [Proteobacteria bacterium]|nr:hydantoinase/oxoprolinase family protein [Pseudomonadota bacterium]